MLRVVDKKVTPKRRRSVAAGDVSPPAASADGPGSSVKAAGHRPGSTGGHTTTRMTVPLSERQQLALLMQMTADEQPTAAAAAGQSDQLVVS